MGLVGLLGYFSSLRDANTRRPQQRGGKGGRREGKVERKRGIFFFGSPFILKLQKMCVDFHSQFPFLLFHHFVYHLRIHSQPTTMKRVRKPTEKIVGAAETRVPQTTHQKYHPKRSRPTVDKERQEAVAAANALKQALKEQVNKTVSAPSVTFALKDKATELILSDDLMNCKGVEGGFRMARATHGVHRGEYYWECQILPSKDPNAHVRIGWSTEKGELQAPVGYDKFSFAYRDIEGSKVHNSQRVDHYGESFGPGDVIGCYLCIANQTEVVGKTGQSQPTQQNVIRFFKNGKDQGVAFSGEQIPSGAGWVCLYTRIPSF